MHGRWAAFAPAAILLLLVLPTAAAVTGSISAMNAQAQAVDASGPLRGLAIDGPAASELFVTAESVSGTIDVVRTDVVVAGAGVTPAQIDSETVAWDAATMRFKASRGGSRILAYALDEANPPVMDAAIATGEFARLATDREYLPQASTTRGATKIPFAETVGVTGAGTLVLRGDFVLVVWSANATIAAASGPQELRTGLTRESTGPLAGVERTELREAYLEIRDGRLESPSLAGVQLATAQANVDVDASGSIVLHEALGLIQVKSRSVALDNSEVVLGEGTTFDAGPGAPGLTIRLDDSRGQVVVNGVRIVEPPGLPARWPAAFALLFLLVILLYVVYVALAWLVGRRLDGLVSAGDFEGGLTLSRKVHWAPRISEKAVVVQAVCLLKLGRVPEARAALESRPRGRDRVRPYRLFLRARIAGLEGDVDEARRLLVDCLLIAPDLRLQALADPVLGPLAAQKSVIEGGYS